MRTNIKLLFIFAYLITISSLCLGQDGLILPMPGQTTTKPTSQNTKKEKNNYTPKEQKNSGNYSRQNNQDPTGAILPMPKFNKKGNNSKSDIDDEEEKITIELDNTPKNPNSEPLIALPKSEVKKKNNKKNNKKKAEKKQEELVTIDNKPSNLSNNDDSNEELSFNDDFFKNNDDFGDDSNDFGDSSDGSNVENILPSTTPETTVAKSSSGENVTVYPKDTGSAIFMVMKSWTCDDYDGVSLINQALEVYAKEAGEEYQIKGLENIQNGLKVSVDEEDITFDELLDIIASKSGNDWGCDIPSKTIYVYPKGIKTESYVSWD